MTRKQRCNRRIEIIKILSEMSRNWSQWRSADWKPLEYELAYLTIIANMKEER